MKNEENQQQCHRCEKEEEIKKRKLTKKPEQRQEELPNDS